MPSDSKCQKWFVELAERLCDFSLQPVKQENNTQNDVVQCNAREMRISVILSLLNLVFTLY